LQKVALKGWVFPERAAKFHEAFAKFVAPLMVLAPTPETVHVRVLDENSITSVQQLLIKFAVLREFVSHNVVHDFDVNLQPIITNVILVMSCGVERISGRWAPCPDVFCNIWAVFYKLHCLEKMFAGGIRLLLVKDGMV
jgi:hypothetical protein